MLVTPWLEVHRIEIKPYCRCSMHRHGRKWNAFVVISGSLSIDVEKAYGLTDTTVLGPGDACTVPPGEFHQFRTGDEECFALELYYPPVLGEDIERRDCGGGV